MAEPISRPWLNQLRRQAGIRHGIVLHGEVLDVRRSEQASRYVPVLEVVREALAGVGFAEVITWDRFTGVDESSRDRWSKLRAASVGSGSEAPAGATEYNVNRSQSRPAGGRNNSVEDALAVIHARLTRPTTEPTAFIIDWSSYLFGNANALTELERTWLLILGRALREAPIELGDNLGMGRPGDLVVFVAPKIGALPPGLYHGNPSVSEVVIPLPDRGERQEFFEHYLDHWNVKGMDTAGPGYITDCIDATDGMAIKDLQQMVRLSRQEAGGQLTFEQLANLYKYGERKSPWEDLSRAKLRTMGAQLRSRVKGQDAAVDKASEIIIRAFTGLSGLQHSKKQRMPKGVMFCVGPTGVGKTELAKSLAGFLFGDEEACIRFDMSEFNHEHSDQRLVGAPPGYVGYEEGGQLTNAVKRKPFSVLLFDEIEKAHVRILDKFLQILEDGRLTDGKGETVYFSETVIIFTSNIGAADIAVSDDAELVKASFVQKVREHFVSAKRPELLNRIGDNIVPFNFIVDDEFLIQIARTKLTPLRERLKEKYKINQFVFADEDRALLALAKSVDRQMGGRGVLNEIVRCLIDPLAKWLFEEEEDFSYFAGRTIRVLQAGDSTKFAFDLE